MREELPSRHNEILAIKYDLVNLRVYLLGSKPSVRPYRIMLITHSDSVAPPLTDNGSLIIIFAEYNFNVKYKPGKQMLWLMPHPAAPIMSLLMCDAVIVIPDLIPAACARGDQCVPLLHALGSGV